MEEIQNIQKKRKVLIDCDPGIDDALALMLALSSPELDVLGITTVCGNVPARIGAENVLRVLKIMGRLDIPVYRGAEEPLRRAYVSAQDTHGMDGLGESGYPRVTEACAKDGAVDFLLETLRREREVSILAIGPLTNIALALRKDREAFGKLDEFVSMGGSFKSHGNCSPVAEYNYWCDPDAAKEVFEGLPGKVHMVGLDVTRKLVLTPNILEYLLRLNRERGEFVRRIVRFYYDFHWEQEHLIGCVINDPLAVAYFIDHKLCRGFDLYTTVETEGISIGQSVVDSMDFWKKKPNSRILTEVDTRSVMAMFLGRICGRLEREVYEDLGEIMTWETAVKPDSEMGI